MKKKLVFTIAGLILAISQSFATGTPIVYTDEATFKAALGSESNLDEFNDLTNGKMVDSLNRTFGDFEYKIEDELKRKDGLYELTGILSFNFKGGASVIDPAVFLITNKGKSINAFGANFYTTDINGNFVSGKEITVKVGTYEYKYIPTKTTSFIGFILPNTIDSIKISCYDSYNTMDNFYVGNTNTTTAVSNVLDKTTITVSPNPVADVMNISTSAIISSVVLKDLTGKTVLESGTSSSINLSSLAKGIYLAKINTANGTTNKRIIKK